MRSLLTDFREAIAEQVEYRELLFQMTRRDLLLRYKQTIMGFGWAIFMPLVNTAVFSIIFTRVAPIQTPVPYPIFAFCGLWVWNFFASALRFSVNSLTSNAGLISKVYFPREIFPLSAVAVCLVDFAIGSVVLIGLLAYYHIPVGPQIVWLPLVLLVHLMLTAAVGLLLSMANLFYRDVKYLFEIVVTMWMFATPVLYPLEGVTGALGLLMRINPMTPIVEAYRAVLLMNTAPSLSFAVMAAVSSIMLVAGWLLFHRLEFKFAETV